MTILAVTTWHERPELLVQQLLNYHAVFGDEIVHVVNINLDFAEQFAAEVAARNIDFSRIPNVHFLDQPVRTRWCGIAQAYLACVMFAMRQGIAFDYVYMHTAADLLIKRGLAGYIREHDIGFGPSPGGIIDYRDDADGEFVQLEERFVGMFVEQFARHRRLPRLLKAIGLPRLYTSRAEGSFMKRDIFFEVMFPLTSYLSLVDMEDMLDPYPIEEMLFPHCVALYCRNHPGTRRVRHVIATSDAEHQKVTIDEIEQSLRTPGVYGVKRFDLLPSRQRSYALELVGLDPDAIAEAYSGEGAAIAA